jgi:hypothetical protein
MSLSTAYQNTQYYLQAGYGLACAVASAEIALFAEALPLRFDHLEASSLRFDHAGTCLLWFDPFEASSLRFNHDGCVAFAAQSCGVVVFAAQSFRGIVICGLIIWMCCLCGSIMVEAF